MSDKERALALIAERCMVPDLFPFREFRVLVWFANGGYVAGETLPYKERHRIARECDIAPAQLRRVLVRLIVSGILSEITRGDGSFGYSLKLTWRPPQ